MTKKQFTVTFLFHRDGGKEYPVGAEIKIRMNVTQDQVDEYCIMINEKHEINPFHAVAAVADDQNFICFDISEIWDANPVFAALQSLKRYREMNATFPGIYTNEGLAKAEEEYAALC